MAKKTNGTHMMPNGKMMKDSEMKNKKKKMQKEMKKKKGC